MKTETTVDIGAVAPEFELNGSAGLIALSGFRGNAQVAIYFVREFACMTCQAHACALSKKAGELNATGTKILVIGGGSANDAVKMSERFKLPFPVLADPNRSVYEEYNLDKALLMFQKSATFLIDSAGIVRYARRSALPSGGLDIAELMNSAKTGV